MSAAPLARPPPPPPHPPAGWLAQRVCCVCARCRLSMQSLAANGRQRLLQSGRREGPSALDPPRLSVEAGGCRLRRYGLCLDGRPGEVRLNCLPARCWLAEARTAQADGTGADVLPAAPSLAPTRCPRPRSLPCCFAVASGAFMCVLWALRLQPVPQVSWADIKALAPVGDSRPCV